MKDFFASDHHVCHRKIIDFCHRPFTDVHGMNEQIVADHNAVVSQEDRVWFVGDFSFGEADETSALLLRMKGQKFLIKGNHDHVRRIKDVRGYADIFQYKELKIGEDHIILSHFPFLEWNRAHYGAYHLHGHSHGTLRYPPSLATARIFDVGIDHLFKINGTYSPVDWDWLKARLEGNAHIQIDHHATREVV